MGLISIFMILICMMSAISGYRRGFTKTAISMISFLAMVLLVSVLNPLLTNIVDNYTGIGEIIEEHCVSYVDGYLENSEPGRNEQISLIENLPLPETVRADLVENNNHVIYEMLGITNFGGYIAAYLVRIVLKAIVFAVSLILACLAVKIIGLCVNGISHMPVVGFFNKTGGLLMGVLGGLFIIWVLFFVIAIFSGMEWAAQALRLIQQDTIANIIYQKNPLIWLLIIFTVV